MFSGGRPPDPRRIYRMQAQRGMQGGRKEQGWTGRPTLIPLRALARRSGRFPPLPCPPPRLLKCTIQDCTMGENRSTLVTVLIRRFGVRIPAAPRQLDVSPGPGPMARRNSDYGAARSPAGRSNRFYRCRADRARARMRPMVRGRPRRDGLRHGRMQKRTTEQTSQIKS